MTTARTARHALGAIVLLVLLLPFVATAAPTVVGAEESYVVLSGSMKPAIAPGDVVVVRDVDPTAIEEGDVITFRRPSADEPITHRVVAVTQREGDLAFRTKGDANEQPDGYTVPADRVVGRVWVTIPYVGHVIDFANSTVGFAVLVLVPFGLLALSEAWGLAVGDDDPAESPGTRANSSEPVPSAPDERTAATTDSDAADGPDPENADTGDASPPSPESPTITLSPRTLTAALAVLAPAALGTGYLAYRTTEAWAVTAFYATFATFAVTGVLYHRMDGSVPDGGEGERVPSDPEAENRSGTGATTEHTRHGSQLSPTPRDQSDTPGSAADTGIARVVAGTVPDALLDRPRVRVTNPDRLRERAAADDLWVIEDRERDAWVLPADRLVYTAPSMDRSEPSAGPGADEAVPPDSPNAEEANGPPEGAARSEP